MLINSHPNPPTKKDNPVTYGINHSFNKKIVRDVETACNYKKREAQNDPGFQFVTYSELPVQT